MQRPKSSGKSVSILNTTGGTTEKNLRDTVDKAYSRDSISPNNKSVTFANAVECHSCCGCNGSEWKCRRDYGLSRVRWISEDGSGQIISRKSRKFSQYWQSCYSLLLACSNKWLFWLNSSRTNCGRWDKQVYASAKGVIFDRCLNARFFNSQFWYKKNLLLFKIAMLFFTNIFGTLLSICPDVYPLYRK